MPALVAIEVRGVDHHPSPKAWEFRAFRPRWELFNSCVSRNACPGARDRRAPPCMDRTGEASGDETRDLVKQVLLFAREELGPASERIVGNAEAQALIVSRLRAGENLEDAVLAEVHRRAGEDRHAADEFLAHFLMDIMRGGRRMVAGDLRRFLDTGDLVQSVVGDMWPELANLRFETKAQFLSFLSKRMRWKALDHRRRMDTLRRSEQKRVELDVGELRIQDDRPTPASVAMSREEREELVLRILRLSERDQLLVRLHLRGEPMSVLSQESGLQVETARKALQRALRKLRNNPES